MVISGLQPGGQAERLLEGPEEGGRVQAFSLVSGARARGGEVFLTNVVGKGGAIPLKSNQVISCLSIMQRCICDMVKIDALGVGLCACGRADVLFC